MPTKRQRRYHSREDEEERISKINERWLNTPSKVYKEKTIKRDQKLNISMEKNEERSIERLLSETIDEKKNTKLEDKTKIPWSRKRTAHGYQTRKKT